MNRKKNQVNCEVLKLNLFLFSVLHCNITRYKYIYKLKKHVFSETYNVKIYF